MTPLRDFCVETILALRQGHERFGEIYVDRTMELYRTYKGKSFGLFSSGHGPDFFQNILLCLNGEEWEEKGEYGNNFRKFINHHRKLDKVV